MVKDGPLVRQGKLLGPLAPHRPTPDHAGPQSGKSGFSLDRMSFPIYPPNVVSMLCGSNWCARPSHLPKTSGYWFVFKGICHNLYLQVLRG